MADMEGWDLLLLVIVGYLAVNLLVRLMIAHRNRIVRQLSENGERSERKSVPHKIEAPNSRKIA